MKLVVLTAVLAVCGAAKLDRTYLPPPSARTAGGSLGAIDAPHENVINNQGLGGLPKGSFTNDFQGVVVDAAAAGTRSSDPNDSGLGAPRQYYGSQDSKVGAAAFKIGGGFGQNHGNDHDEYVEGSADAFRTSSNRFGALKSGNPQGHASASSFASHGSAQNQNFDSGFKSGQERPQAAQERAANTIRFESDVGPENFNFAYETDNGIMAAENGVEANGIKAEGGYSYTGDDGQVYSISYTADEGGYQPHGDHLPTPPPIPEEILRSLEQNKRDEEAGIVDDGSYDAQKYNGGEYSKSDNNNGQYNLGSSGSHGSSASSSASFGGQSGNSGKYSHSTNNNQGLNVADHLGGNFASANSFVGNSQYNKNNNQQTFSGHDTTDVQGVGSASSGFESHAQGQNNRNIYSKHQGTSGNQVPAASTNNFSTDQLQGQSVTHSAINQDFPSQQHDTIQQQYSFGQQSSHSSGFSGQGQNNLHNQASASAEFNSNRGNIQNQVGSNENHQLPLFGTKNQQPNKNGYLPPLGNQQGHQQTLAQSSTNQAFSSASSNNGPQQQKQQSGQLHQEVSQQSTLNNLNQRPDAEERPTFVALNEKPTIASSGFGSAKFGGPSNIHMSNEQHITSSRFGSKPQSNLNNVDTSDVDSKTKFGQGSTNSFVSSTGHGANTIPQSSSGLNHSTGFTQVNNRESLFNSNRFSGNQQLNEASRPSSAFASSQFEGGFVSSQSNVNSPSRFSNSITTPESATDFGSNDDHSISNQHFTDVSRPTQTQNDFGSSHFGSGTTTSQSNINRGPTQSQNSFASSKFGSSTTPSQSNINREPTQSQIAFGSSQFSSGTTSSQSNINGGPTQSQNSFSPSKFGSSTTPSQSNINRGPTQSQIAFGSSQFSSGTTSSQSNINRGPTQPQNNFASSKFGSSTTPSQSNVNRGPTQSQTTFGSSQFSGGSSNFNSPVTSTESNTFSSSQAAFNTDENQGHLSNNDNRFGSNTHSPYFNQHSSASSQVINSGSSKDDSYYYKQPAKPFGITAGPNFSSTSFNKFNSESQNINTGSQYNAPTQNKPSPSFQSQQSSQYQQTASNRFSGNSPQPFSQQQNIHSLSSATPQISQPSQQHTGFSQQGVQKHTTAIPHPFTPLGKQPLTDTQKIQAPQQFGQFSGSTQQTSSRFTASQQPASPFGSASASSHSSFSNQGSHISEPNASSASTQQYDGEIYEYTKPAEMLPVPNKDQDGSSTHVSSQSAVSQGFRPQGPVNQFSAQSVSGKGEVFGGPRKPPSFDSETGYHY